jgi:muconolactone delta-isomerase
MQFLSVTRRRTELFSPEAFEAIIPHEQEHARQFYIEGFFRQIWHRGDMGGAVMLLEADSLEEAKAKLGTLPLAEKGMLEIVTVIPLKPYAGFGPRLT